MKKSDKFWIGFWGIIILFLLYKVFIIMRPFLWEMLTFSFVIVGGGILALLFIFFLDYVFKNLGKWIDNFNDWLNNL